MRLKQLWDYFPLPAKLRLVWDRLTLSRLTTIYFAIALFHCLVQVGFQIGALYINTRAVGVVSSVAAADPNTPAGIEWLTQGGALRSCTGEPGSIGDTPCQVVWAGKTSPDGPEETPEPSLESQTRTTTVDSSSEASTASSTSKPATPSTRTVFVAVTNIAVQSQQLVPDPSAVSTFASASVSSSSSVPAPASAPTPAPQSPPTSEKRPALFASLTKRGLSRRDITLTPVFSEFNGTFQGVRLYGLTTASYDKPNEMDAVFVSKVCVDVLQWPLQKLRNTQREDAVFIGFQFWVLGMSVVALLNESVPHVIAAFLTHILVTAWSIFQIVHTANFRSDFNRLTVRGACGGVNLLPTYWTARANAEIPVLVLNAVALIASAYISWKLLKTFGWLTFKRVGASLEINRIYNLVLSLGIVLQLSLFFVVVSAALWLVQLNGPAAIGNSMVNVYKVVAIVQLIALAPWIVMGWYAVRREMRKTMIAFLVLSALFIVAWAGMFVSAVWRLLFITWLFFRIMSVTAATLSVLAFGLGLACWLNFGKDFPKHLQNQGYDDGSDFTLAQPSSDPEKVDFPTPNRIPTFTEVYVSRDSIVSSTHSRLPSAEVAVPAHAVVRLPIRQSVAVEHPDHSRLSRMNSAGSSTTTGSVRGPFEFEKPVGFSTVGMGKRWVIE